MNQTKSSYERAIAFDIQAIGQEFLDDPYPTYRLLREYDPVHKNPDGTYFLTRYEDVIKAFRDPGMSRQR